MKYLSDSAIQQRYERAREQYAYFGVDTEQALARLAQISISLHCWQGDDVNGFEIHKSKAGAGNPITGAYPGRARTIRELQQDLNFVYNLIPGQHRLNLHAIYADSQECGVTIDRAKLEPVHFASWLAWAKKQGIKLDFNPTLFAHDKAADGLTLSHPDKAIQDYWIEHCRSSRRIANYFGQELQDICINNIWAVDGFKDTPVDRFSVRARLKESLDEIFAESYPYVKDAIEGKLFGIGSEGCVVGSHEFYLAYALQNKKLLCYDLGHFHPTESVADKLSAVLLFLDEMLLHVSRPVHWDSDHVVTLNDELLALCHELVRGACLDKIHIALDYFDASINRLAAWIIGMRNTQKALLISLLENTKHLQQAEKCFDFTERLALTEEYKSLDFGAVWDYFCLQNETPAGIAWLGELAQYNDTVLSKR